MWKGHSNSGYLGMVLEYTGALVSPPIDVHPPLYISTSDSTVGPIGIQAETGTVGPTGDRVPGRGYITIGRRTLREALNLPSDVSIIWATGSATSNGVTILMESERFPWTFDEGEYPRYSHSIDAYHGHVDTPLGEPIYVLSVDLPLLDTEASINRGESI